MAISHSAHRRAALLDELRGFFILLMVAYHATYDIVEIFDVNFPLFYSTLIGFLQLSIAGNFVFISGAVCRYSHANVHRGVQVFVLGMLLTLATWLVLPSQIVMFGVLHLLGICMMLFPIVSPVLDKVHPTIGILICTFLFLMTYFIPHGLLGFPPFTVNLPHFLYETSFLFPLGFPSDTFFSSDYFPVLPWFFFFYAGACFGTHLKAEKLPAWVYSVHFPSIATIGRYTIWIYILHQPIIYVFLLILSAFGNL